jgi:hypothetical protein
MNVRKLAVLALGVPLLLLVGCGGDADEARARVEIVEPADGSTVTGPEVRVVLRTHGAQVEPADNRRTPNRGHHHLYVNQDLTSADQPIPMGAEGIVHMGDGSTEYVLTDLAPGEHRLIAWFAYGDHVPLEEVSADTVHFTLAPAVAGQE